MITRRVSKMYLLMIFVSVTIMIVAAYITYGHQGKKIRIIKSDNNHSNINNNEQDKKVSKDKTKSLSIGSDLSNIPSDKQIEDILNDVLPNICDDCDEDPLDCLESYKMNKIIIKNREYNNKLKVEILTGKRDNKKYTVVIDLSNNSVVDSQGSMDKKECIEVEDADQEAEEVKYDIMLNGGQDPKNSLYINK